MSTLFDTDAVDKYNKFIKIYKVSSSDINNIDSRNIANSEAYRVYLKGKYIYHNRQSNKDILNIRAKKMAIANNKTKGAMAAVLYANNKESRIQTVMVIDCRTMPSYNEL